MSKNNVKIAIDLFPVLNTLVAPIFLEPIFLISIFKNILVKISPKGMEPIIYEIKNIKNISKDTIN